MLRQFMLLLHLLSAMAWIGGMFFAYFCLRPAAAAVLQPPQRLPLWTATFARFLPYTGFAVAMLLASWPDHVAGTWAFATRRSAGT